MKLFCIGDEDTVRGFRLAGVAGRVATTVQETEAAFVQAISRPEHGIVIFTETAAAAIRSQVDAFRLERDLPLVLEIPGSEGPLTGGKSLGQRVQEAVGIRVDREEGG